MNPLAAQSRCPDHALLDGRARSANRRRAVAAAGTAVLVGVLALAGCGRSEDTSAASEPVATREAAADSSEKWIFIEPPVGTEAYREIQAADPSGSEEPLIPKPLKPDPIDQRRAEAGAAALSDRGMTLDRVTVQDLGGARITTARYWGPEGRMNLNWHRLAQPYGLPNEVRSAIEAGRAQHARVDGIEIFVGEAVGLADVGSQQFVAATNDGVLVTGAYQPVKETSVMTAEEVARFVEVVAQ